MKKLSCIILLILISILPFAGCKAVKAPLITEELYALDTIITINIYSGQQEAVSFAKDEISRLESLLSVTDTKSDVYRINSNPDEFISVSDECFELIRTAVRISDSTKGNFDITVYPAVLMWGFTTSEYKVPEQSEILDVKEKIGYNKITLDENSKSVKIPLGTSLDLGAIAKGYIADKAAQALVENGVTSALLNFGGNVRLIGTKPEGEDFKIGIKAPFSEGYFATLNAKDTTASTAGGYERYFEENGVMYHHILNPHTATPAVSDILSATVIGDNGAVCDALATASFVTGSEDIKSISSAYPDYGFILLTENTVYLSEVLSDNFTLTEEYKNLQIIII